MSDEANGTEVYLYVISCRLERIKIGVAGDARKRLRELQVGSPVELKLALTRPYAERRDADAVADELYRYFAGRRVRGSWYRLSAGEVRERLGQRDSLEAPARARAAAEAASERRVAPRRGREPMRARTEKQGAYERRRTPGANPKTEAGGEAARPGNDKASCRRRARRHHPHASQLENRPRLLARTRAPAQTRRPAAHLGAVQQPRPPPTVSASSPAQA